MKGNPGLSAGYAGTSGFRQVVKCTILIKKKEGLSDEDFVEYYNTKHAKMATDVIIRHDPISYSLTYHLSSDRRHIQDILHGKAQLLDYDAICTFVFPDWKAFAKFMYDKDCKNLSSDHDNFMDESQMKMMVGDEYMLVEDGKRCEHP